MLARISQGMVLLLLVLPVIAARGATGDGIDEVSAELNSGEGAWVRKAVEQIRTMFRTNDVRVVDRLNESWMGALEKAKRYEEVEEFAQAGTLAAAADTWRIEQLQKHRIKALMAQGKSEEALQAAKGLFNVCGMGFTKDALPILVDALKAAHPSEPGIVPKFKLQVLANAQEDPAERKRLLQKYGGNSVMESIPADPEPWAGEIEKRKGLTDYRGMYGRGNLLLMAGRIKEAHDVFMQVYKIAPAGELNYASEGVAKLIKAEDGGLGKANQFVMSIRPKENGQ